ncbi:MAG: GNAT family N-acetyltransferase [Desulfovibrionales bacterium]|nr:GNAT family N-acetyltransferase [Desulfovibrionales bacterium]
MEGLQTPRLVCMAVTPAHFSEIFSLYQRNQALLALLDHEHDPAHLATRFVRKANVPLGGSVRQLSKVVLFSPDQTKIRGLCSVYYGYPEPHIAYVGELFFAPDAQRMGLGRELYLALEAQVRVRSMQAVRVGVGLRNWNALRFWIRLGFVHITGMSGARDFTPQAYAFLELEKNCTP